MAAVSRPRALPLAKVRTGIVLGGVKDGVNLVFTTPGKFRRIGGATIAVYWNGLRLREGPTEDYSVSESGGPGTGYDTVTLAVALLVDDNLIADYIAA